MLNLEKLGKGIRRGNITNYICPACRNDDNGDRRGENHLGVYPGGKFCCVKYPNNKDHNKRIVELVGQGDDTQTPHDTQSECTVQQNVRVFPDSCTSRLLPLYDYWVNRGIPVEILRKFEGGYASANQFGGYYVFINRNEQNQIIGFSGRLVLDRPKKPKWKHVGKKTNFIFGLKHTKSSIMAKREIVLVESIGNFLSLFTSGIENVMVAFGISISTKLTNKIVALNPSKIIIAFDPGAPGQEGAEKTKAKLSEFFDEESIEIRNPKDMDLNEMLLKHKEEGIREWYENT